MTRRIGGMLLALALCLALVVPLTDAVGLGVSALLSRTVSVRVALPAAVSE